MCTFFKKNKIYSKQYWHIIQFSRRLHYHTQGYNHKPREYCNRFFTILRSVNLSALTVSLYKEKGLICRTSIRPLQIKPYISHAQAVFSCTLMILLYRLALYAFYSAVIRIKHEACLYLLREERSIKILHFSKLCGTEFQC